MWMVSRLIVIPFQPRRIAPFGDPLPHMHKVLQKPCQYTRDDDLPGLLQSHLLGLNRGGSHRRLLEYASNAFPCLHCFLKDFIIGYITMFAANRIIHQAMPILTRFIPGQVEEFPLTHVNMRFDPLVKYELHSIVCHLFSYKHLSFGSENHSV